MKKLSFSNYSLPKDYKLLKDGIENLNSVIQLAYSKFKFQYLPIHQIKETENINPGIIDDNIEFFLFDYLDKIKFITYCYTNQNLINNELNQSTKITNFIVCLEGECIIIEQIDQLFMNKIIDKLKVKHPNSIIEVNYEINRKQTIKKAYDLEIYNFCNEFINKIDNIFVKYTITPIIGYLIGRFFYPTTYFKDPSFFIFDRADKILEQHIKSELYDFILQVQEDKEKVNQISSKMNDFIFEIIKYSTLEIKKKQFNFNEKDFIMLNEKFINKVKFQLAIHRKSLYIFMLKFFDLSDLKEKSNNREIYFCENFSNRFMTPFYGFLTNNRNNKIGVVYEYMSNDNLVTYLKNNDFNQDNFNLYSMILIIRILKGIEYLQSNSLIHRDLKPSNILIDHDGLPYIHDFETIRFINNNDNITNDLGSYFYSSPEQDSAENVSFPTDIYSFGLIIYYLYERENMISSYNKKNVKPIHNCSTKINEIYLGCVKFNPKERFTKDIIQKKIIEEINDFLLDSFILKGTAQKFHLFLFECILSQYFNPEVFNEVYYYSERNCIISGCKRDYIMKLISDLKDNFDEISVCSRLNKNSLTDQDYLVLKRIYESEAKKSDPVAIYNLGIMYYTGRGVKKNQLQAIRFFELAAKFEFPEALGTLGDIYYKEKDYLKAIYYLELAAKHNQASSLYELYLIYYYGYGVEINKEKAINYLKLAGKQNYVGAFIDLGLIYLNGIYVARDVSRAIYYLKLAAEQNNLVAIYNLGIIYKIGYGVKRDYSQAKYYFELLVKQNYSYGFVQLGYFYLNGEGVKQDYLKAIHYIELAAKLHNVYAFLLLGAIYEDGKVTKKDYLKSKYYYELAAKQNHYLAIYQLSEFFSTGENEEIDIPKAIQYLMKCTESKRSCVRDLIGSIILESENYFYYRAYNDLGLIYLTILNDQENAFKCIKKSGLNEFPYGKNNLGLYYQLYLHEKEKAIYMFEKASKDHFALSEYNLGYLYELDQKIDECIIHYIKASEYENEPLIFHNHHHYDKRLEISKKFIICMTNLIITLYYFSQRKYEETKEYFIKSLSKLINISTFQFHFEIQKEYKNDVFSYLRFFILDSPLFNLINQPNIKPDFKDQIEKNRMKPNHQLEIRQEKCKKINKKPNNNSNEEKLICNEKYINDVFIKPNNKEIDTVFSTEKKSGEKIDDPIDNVIIFTNASDLIQFVICNTEYHEIFKKELEKIIGIMKEILYTSPYNILFGRISIAKHEFKSNPFIKNIDKSFYEGFGIKI